MHILAIDQGTSGTKAIVVDPEDGVCGLAEVPVHPHYLNGGGVEQDPDELLASVLQAGRAAVASAGRPIDAVSLANQGETVLAWDPATGRPLTQAIVWQDRRAEALCAGLAAHRDLFAARTGLPQSQVSTAVARLKEAGAGLVAVGWMPSARTMSHKVAFATRLNRATVATHSPASQASARSQRHLPAASTPVDPITAMFTPSVQWG